MTFLRLCGSLLLAAGLMFTPATAFAEDYPENTADAMVVTDTNPEPGETFTVILEAGPESTEATLTVTSDDASDSDIAIAGTQSMTKPTNAAGIAEFSVTLYAEGVYTLIGYDDSGDVISRAQVVVGDGEPGEDGANRPGTGADSDGSAGAGSDGSAGAGSGDSGAGIGLGDTGAASDSVLLAGGGVLLLAGGAAALLYSRRRKLQLT